MQKFVMQRLYKSRVKTPVFQAGDETQSQALACLSL